MQSHFGKGLFVRDKCCLRCDHDTPLNRKIQGSKYYSVSNFWIPNTFSLHGTLKIKQKASKVGT